MDLLAFILALQADGKTSTEIRAAVNQYLEDNPDAIDQDAVEAILDGRLDDIVLAQETQPTAEDNRIWFPTETGETVQVPTYAEYSELKSAIQNITSLPDGYTQLEYLVSDGSQRLSLGFNATQDTRSVVDFQMAELPSDGTAYVFGGRETASSRAYAFGYTSDEQRFFVNYNNSAFYTPADLKRHIIDINKNSFYIDNVLFDTATEATFTSYRVLYAFACYGRSGYYYGSVKIFDMKFFENDVLIHHFIPVKQVNTNALGLYDLVENTFKTPNEALNGEDVNIKTLHHVVGNNSNDIEEIKTDIEEIKTDISPIIRKEYIQNEADRVAENVRNIQTGDTLTFIAVSDMHYSVDDNVVQDALDDMRSGIQAVAEQTHIDFYASFGDIIYRLSTNGNFDKGKSEIISATKILNDAFNGNHQIRMTGNHDPNAEGDVGYFTPDQMNAFTGIYSDMLTKPNDISNGGFGYHDFEKQKIRLIVLNTSYYSNNPTQNSTQYSMTNAQAGWLADALDISDKPGYENWQIVIFAHIAMDQLNSSGTDTVNSGALSKYTKIFDAYISGGSWSVTGYSHDYAGKNSAKLAAYINGHQHAYLVKNLNYYNTNRVLQYPLSLANLYIPNALAGRDYPSIDGVTYTKTSGTAQSTAFDVITLDPVAKVVYAHHYGAGIDIILHYEPTTASSLTTALTSPAWSTNDSTIATVSDGTVTPVAAGYTMVWAKSTADNTIEVWNYQAVV